MLMPGFGCGFRVFVRDLPASAFYKLCENHFKCGPKVVKMPRCCCKPNPRVLKEIWAFTFD